MTKKMKLLPLVFAFAASVCSAGDDSLVSQGLYLNTGKKEAADVAAKPDSKELKKQLEELGKVQSAVLNQVIEMLENSKLTKDDIAKMKTKLDTLETVTNKEKVEISKRLAEIEEVMREVEGSGSSFSWGLLFGVPILTAAIVIPVVWLIIKHYTKPENYLEQLRANTSPVSYFERLPKTKEEFEKFAKDHPDAFKGYSAQLATGMIPTGEYARARIVNGLSPKEAAEAVGKLLKSNQF
jgi:hypothetical protein